jgi:hypothetical protein
MRRTGRLSDRACSAARSQVIAAHDDVDRQLGQTFRQTPGVLLPQRGERVRVVLIARLEGICRVGFALTVANNDELLMISLAAIRFTSELMNSWVTVPSTVSVSLRCWRSCRCSAWSSACISWAL